MNQTGVKIIRATLYLEGIEVKFVNISINEKENQLPDAFISIVPNEESFRILPGTLVQVFVEVESPILKIKEDLLIFEGEITSLSYQKSISGRQLSFSAVSCLQRTYLSQFKASDSIVRDVDEMANGIYRVDQYIASQKGSLTISGAKGIYSSLGGIIGSIITELEQKSPASYGNFQPLINKYMQFFEMSDVFYGLQALSLKLPVSIFSFPNFKFPQGFRLKVVQRTLYNFFTGANSALKGKKEYSFAQFIQEFLDIIHYQMFAPAAFPAVSMFFNKGCPGYKPLRMFYMPIMESGPPALCNIFFPEQVQSVAFSKNYAAEPTRLISSFSFEDLTTSGDLPSNLSQIYVVPDIIPEFVLNQPTNYGRSLTKFTFEESYRGILPQYMQFPIAYTQSLVKEHLDIDKNHGKQIIKALNNVLKVPGTETQNLLRDFTLDMFLNMKFSNRMLQLNTDWSPYRFVGLPGMFFTPGSPTFVGIVSNITTTINAQGAAQQQVGLRNCRIIFDENYGTVFNAQHSKYKNKDDLASYIVGDSSMEGMNGANELMFDPTYYNFEVIGEDVYTYLINGQLAPAGRFSELSKGTGIWKDYASELKTAPTNINIDNSILRFIKDADKFNELTNKAGATPRSYYYNYVLANLKNWADAPVELVNTEILSMAISAFKTQYLEIKKTDTTVDTSTTSALKQFITSITYRHIISKNEYLTFINAFNDSSDLTKIFADAKDMTFFLSLDSTANAITAQKTYSIDDIKDFIAMVGEDLRNSTACMEIITYIKNFFLKNYITALNNVQEKIKKITDRNNELGDNGVVWVRNRISPSLPYDQMNKQYTYWTSMWHKLKKSYPKVLKQLKQMEKDLQKEIADKQKKSDLLTDVTDVYMLFNPYNITRKAHVYYSTIKTLYSTDNSVVVGD